MGATALLRMPMTLQSMTPPPSGVFCVVFCPSLLIPFSRSLPFPVVPEKTPTTPKNWSDPARSTRTNERLVDNRAERARADSDGAAAGHLQGTLRAAGGADADWSGVRAGELGRIWLDGRGLRTATKSATIQ